MQQLFWLVIIRIASKNNIQYNICILICDLPFLYDPVSWIWVTSCRANTQSHKTLIRSFFTLITTHGLCVINDKGDLVETNCLLVYLFILIDPLKCKENEGKYKTSNCCFYVSGTTKKDFCYANVSKYFLIDDKYAPSWYSYTMIVTFCYFIVVQ